MWEPCSTFGSLKNLTTLERLGFIASEYFPIDTQKAPVSVKYVCGVNPSCPAMTSCVMSEQEFNTEMGLIRKGIPSATLLRRGVHSKLPWSHLQNPRLPRARMI